MKGVDILVLQLVIQYKPFSKSLINLPTPFSSALVIISTSPVQMPFGSAENMLLMNIWLQYSITTITTISRNPTLNREMYVLV